jgi:hypothetical protein
MCHVPYEFPHPQFEDQSQSESVTAVLYTYYTACSVIYTQFSVLRSSDSWKGYCCPLYIACPRISPQIWRLNNFRISGMRSIYFKSLTALEVGKKQAANSSSQRCCWIWVHAISQMSGLCRTYYKSRLVFDRCMSGWGAIMLSEAARSFEVRCFVMYYPPEINCRFAKQIDLKWGTLNVLSSPKILFLEYLRCLLARVIYVSWSMLLRPHSVYESFHCKRSPLIMTPVALKLPCVFYTKVYARYSDLTL